MKIFVSYSFRPENRWVTQYVKPLLQCLGHEVLTGEIVDSAATIDEGVKKKIRQCRWVMCFVTRGRPRHDGAGAVVGYEPPDWVRDELIVARARDQAATEYREQGVEYGGIAPYYAYRPFDRDRLPDLLLDVAEVASQWPVGPIQLRLAFPDEVQDEIMAAARAGILRARCSAIEEVGADPVVVEELKVHLRGEQLLVAFWVKRQPNLSIDIEVVLGARRLVCPGVSPLENEARLRTV